MTDLKTSAEPVTATSFANGDLLRLSQDLGGSTFGNAKIDWTHIAAQIAGLPKGWSTITGTPTTLGGYGITDALMFRTISVAGQSDIVADTTADTLTVVAGTNVTLTTNAATDTLTIAASGGSATPAGSDTQVQFNNAGAFGASATFKFKLTPTPTLIFGDVLTGVDLIVASDTGVSGHVDGRNLIINGGDGFDNGASGNAAGGGLEFSGGDSHGASDAGDAEIGGGNAADSGAGGPVFVFGGNSNSGTGGDVHLNPGNSTSGTKGKISGKIPGGADVTLFDQAMALPLARLPSVATGNYLANLSGGTATPSYNTSASVAMNLGPLISNYSYAAGLYNGQTNNTTGTAIVVVNRVVYIPIICPAVGLAVQAISFRITGGGTGGNNCQVAVYTDVAGVPTTLVVNSVSATVPAGTGTVNVPLSFNTPATHFWVAINFDTVAVQPTCINSSSLNTGRFFAAATLGNMLATVNTCFIKAQTFGTWQTTASGLTVTGADCNLWIEYA